MFVEKVRINVKEALADSVLLLKTSSRDYIPFVELGKTSEYYHHDLYHLLASRGIDALLQVEKLGSGYTETNAVNPVKQDIIAIYGNMLSAYKAAGLKEGYVLTALNYLEWRRGAERYIRPLQVKGEASVLTDDTYLKALNTLKSKYASEPICAEVYLAQARYAIEKQQQVNALQLCDEAIRLYPGYDRINALKNLREEILAPYLNVYAADQAFPNEEIELRASVSSPDESGWFYRPDLSGEETDKRTTLLCNSSGRLPDTGHGVYIQSSRTWSLRNAYHTGYSCKERQ